MPKPSEEPLITIDEVRQAAQRLRGHVLRTPLLAFGSASYVKPESLQPTGSFKLRGAYNAISRLDAERRARGVVTHSSGNHGQAVARVCRSLGIRAVIVMPSDAPQLKIRRVAEDGAEIVFVGPSHEERRDRAHGLAHDEGLTLVPSADDRHVISGQATAGLEIVEDLLEAGVEGRPTILVPVGQGGLAAGVASAVKALLPEARVFGVEPALAADGRESLASGRIVRWAAEQVGRTMADGMRMESLAPLPFRHLQRHLDGILTIEEADIAHAMARAASDVRLVLEPSGATALAALIRHGAELQGGPLVAVLSGGNVDPERYLALLRISGARADVGQGVAPVSSLDGAPEP